MFIMSISFEGCVNAFYWVAYIRDPKPQRCGITSDMYPISTEYAHVNEAVTQINDPMNDARY